MVQETEEDEGRVRGVDDKLMSTSMSIRAHAHTDTLRVMSTSVCVSVAHTLYVHLMATCVFL